jgi:hypothetical protein
VVSSTPTVLIERYLRWRFFGRILEPRIYSPSVKNRTVVFSSSSTLGYSLSEEDSINYWLSILSPSRLDEGLNWIVWVMIEFLLRFTEDEVEME